jgi:hypothetical protein
MVRFVTFLSENGFCFFYLLAHLVFCESVERRRLCSGGACGRSALVRSVLGGAAAQARRATNTIMKGRSCVPIRLCVQGSESGGCVR